MHFTKLFNSILDSTIWQENKETKIVWVTMLAMCDRSGEIHASIPGLAARSGVTIPECESALLCLMSPDHYSRTKDHEGRRIEEIDGGWVLLNHGKYRALLSAEERREYNRIKQKQHRAKQSLTVNDMSANVSNVNAGEHITEAEAEAEAEAEKTQTQAADADIVTSKPPKKTRAAKTDLPVCQKFEEFWSIYPRRTAKGHARKAWETATGKTDATTILMAVDLFAKATAGTEQRFIPHPATWLNAERWADDFTKTTNGHQSSEAWSRVAEGFSKFDMECETEKLKEFIGPELWAVVKKVGSRRIFERTTFDSAQIQRDFEAALKGAT